MSDHRYASSFAPALLNSELDPEIAAGVIREMLAAFSHQMWHDLAQQGHIELRYENSYRDRFGPSELFDSSESLLDELSPDIYDVDWIDKEEAFDLEYAKDIAEAYGESVFGELFRDFPDGEAFSTSSLGYAIGAGLGLGDLEVLDDAAFDTYLEACYGNDRNFYKVHFEVISDTYWEGARFRELTESEQMHLARNLISSLSNSYLGEEHGISQHLIDCLVQHDDTAESVRSFLQSSKA